ncbi:MAG: C-terminal helicase domain-containing protein [Candidatus Korobacteraceae bacterium]|jgi:SNF2 family DNA or RNA helicase
MYSEHKVTITEANHVIHYGRWWNPAVEAQATDRVYRIGQERDVRVYLPTLKDPSGRISNSFDERLHRLLEQKSTLASVPKWERDWTRTAA